MFSGFDLMEVGQDEVTLRTGKQANRRSIQFVLQALLALFGKCMHLTFTILILYIKYLWTKKVIHLLMLYVHHSLVSFFC